ncbi:MAG: DUF3127 domain-containing protein [Flavobacteriales bacterium]|nr:DUF3127 domain-containing protein [Flavobacteriales bacterium]
MEVIGTIKKINPAVQITPTFTKSELVISTDEMYPQVIMVEFAQSRASLVDSFQVGAYVKVSINLRGREWTDPKTGEVRYFTSVSGWRIEASAPGAAQGAPASASAPAANPFNGQSAPAQPAPAASPTGAPSDDDLPF